MISVHRSDGYSVTRLCILFLLIFHHHILPMRIVPFVISAVVTTGLVYCLNKSWGKIPPIGKFVSPQVGFWQNAEPSGQSFDADLSFPDLKGKAEVYIDERLVPHVFAENDEDLYFIQGFLHAKFRLFQMDLQTKAAAGRASEIAGSKAIRFDREQRRLGMVYAAENALKEINLNCLKRMIPLAKLYEDSGQIIPS